MQNDMRDRLVEIIEQSGMLEGKIRSGIVADELIANGVIIPPCKVGDKVYAFSYPRTDIIVIDEETVEDCHFIVETDECYYDERDIGRTIFLTKDQAEQKLKELSENG